MDLISLLVTVVVLGLVFWLLWWLIGVIGLPEPFNKVATVLIALIAVVILLGIVFGGVNLPTLRIGR
jgi:heme A synthase